MSGEMFGDQDGPRRGIRWGVSHLETMLRQELAEPPGGAHRMGRVARPAQQQRRHLQVRNRFSRRKVAPGGASEHAR